MLCDLSPRCDSQLIHRNGHLGKSLLQARERVTQTVPNYPHQASYGSLSPVPATWKPGPSFTRGSPQARGDKGGFAGPRVSTDDEQVPLRLTHLRENGLDLTVSPKEQRRRSPSLNQHQPRIGRRVIRPVDAGDTGRVLGSPASSASSSQRLVYEHFKLTDIAKRLARHSCIAQSLAELFLADRQTSTPMHSRPTGIRRARIVTNDQSSFSVGAWEAASNSGPV